MTTVRDRIMAVLDGSVGYEPGLDALTVAPSSEVDPELLAVLHEACARLWRGGWQPVELHRVVARRGGPMHARLVTDAVAAHLRQFPRAGVDGRWLAQADALGAQVWWRDSDGYLDAVANRHNLARVAVLDAVLTLLGTLAGVPPIEVLVPPPGSTAPAGAGRTGRAGSEPGRAGAGPGGQARLLDRVRALLAKAESSQYPAEAETYTAKAQELITRHSLEDALLAARAGERAVTPYARRIGVDHPYEDQKAALLDAVARANRCQAVWSPELGFATVFGFDGDLAAVDLLHTSLLVQAHRAMARTEPPGGKAGRARLRTFRQSFLVAFAVRIGERLTEAAQATLAQAAGGDAGAAPDPGAADRGGPTGDGPTGDGPAGGADTAGASGLLPVLAARDEQVRQTMRSVFPRTVRARGVRAESREGWDSGRAAADSVALPDGGSARPGADPVNPR